MLALELFFLLDLMSESELRDAVWSLESSTAGLVFFCDWLLNMSLVLSGELESHVVDTLLGHCMLLSLQLQLHLQCYEPSHHLHVVGFARVFRDEGHVG